MTVIYAIYVILRHFGTSFHVITRHLGHCNVTYVIRRLNTTLVAPWPQGGPKHTHTALAKLGTGIGWQWLVSSLVAQGVS